MAPRPPPQRSTPPARAPWWPSALAAGLAMVFFAWHAPSVAGDKDSAELTLALAFAGVAHPTGYPLYVVFGHGFDLALVALGSSWSFAANLWSALGGAIATGFLHALASRLIDHPRRAALAALPVVLFATNPMWTIETTLAEVYSWHVAWALAAVFFFVRALEQLRAGEGNALRLAAGWGLLCGLGGAHHATALLVAAPLSVALLLAARKLKRAGAREVGLVVGSALVPLLSLGFVAWRAFHPPAWQWPTLEPTWASAWSHVTGGEYGHYLGTFAPSPEQQGYLGRFVYPALWPTFGTFLVLAFASKQRWLLAPLLVTTSLGILFAFSYGVPDPSAYFLVPLALSCAGAGGVLSELASLRRHGRAVVAVASVVVAAIAFSWSGSARDRRLLFESFDAQVRSMWSSVPDQPTFLLWPSDMSARVQLFQLLEGQKPNVELVNPLLLPNPVVRAAFIARHGFDPLEGVDVPRGAIPGDGRVWPYTEDVGRRLNARGARVVVLFDPEHDSVRMMRRP